MATFAGVLFEKGIESAETQNIISYSKLGPRRAVCRANHVFVCVEDQLKLCNVDFDSHVTRVYSLRMSSSWISGQNVQPDVRTVSMQGGRDRSDVQ